MDSFLGNMDFDLELENVAKLGLTAELGDHGELDEADLQDPGTYVIPTAVAP